MFFPFLTEECLFCLLVRHRGGLCQGFWKSRCVAFKGLGCYLGSVTQKLKSSEYSGFLTANDTCDMLVTQLRIIINSENRSPTLCYAYV